MIDQAASSAGRSRRRTGRRLAIGGFTAVALAAGIAFADGWPPANPWQAPFSQRVPASASGEPAVERLVLDTELMPVSVLEAEQINASRPNDRTGVVAAHPFTIRDSVRTDPRFLAALDCLGQAVYYEAAGESDGGQRAVAQVVLNRVRHPAFPNTVCGVVYQGAQLATGCQFTFTCDGNLARQPSISGWARARRIALAALSGWVEPTVGTATHYHASYVVPYWAASLDKVETVGAHIFYMMPGKAGAREAFVARYDLSGEAAPASWSADLFDEDALAVNAFAVEEPAISAPLPIPSLQADLVSLGEPEAAAGRLAHPSSSRLREDERQGVLIAGERNSELLVD